MNRLRLALLALTPLWPLGCGDGDDPSIPQPLVDRAAPHAAGAGPQQKRITPLRRWVKREPAHSPPPRSGAAFAYDPLLKVSILFGGWGCSQGNCGLLDDTWEWNGVDWTELESGSIPARVCADAAFDPALGGVNVVGGSFVNTPSNASHYWSGGAWIPTDTTVPGFSLAGRALAYEAGAAPRMLSFGGDDITSRVRDFTGQRAPGSYWIYPSLSTKPSARRDGALVWDPVADKSYLFGGRPCRMDQTCGALGDYWEIGGTTWTTLGNSTSRPSPRFGHRFLYDAARGVGVLFGGQNGTSANGELWQVAFPDTWTEIPTLIGPEGRSYFGFSYDSERDVAVLFGGSAGTTLPQGDPDPFGDTWELVLDHDSCQSGADCDNGFCVDGNCCEVESCGSCETCGDPTNPGLCIPVVDAPDPDSCNTTCDSSGQCQPECSSDDECPGACNACQAGRCEVLADQPDPSGTCNGYLCDGVDPGCPTFCTNSSDCVEGVPCKGGLCTLQGEPCDDASSCGGLTCIDNVCCGSPCDVCGVCSALRGSPEDGECSPAPKGSPDDACPVGCSGTDTACLDSAALPAGSPCEESSDCSSGSCVAGSCCDDSPAVCVQSTRAETQAHGFAAGTPHDCLCRAGAPAGRTEPLGLLAPLGGLGLLLRRRRRP